jgi:hypothetical protein
MGLGEDQCTDAWISPHDVQADGPDSLNYGNTHTCFHTDQCRPLPALTAGCLKMLKRYTEDKETRTRQGL